MLMELNNLLDFDEKTPPNGKTILITESNAEGAFVIHHLISLYLKGGHNVCLISFAHSFNHYNNVAAKLGVKLSNAKENGNFVFLGELDTVGKAIIGICNGKSGSNSLVKEILGPSPNDDCVKSLCEAFEATFKSLNDYDTKPTLFIVDGLSTLIHLGVPAMDVVWLMQYLQHFTLVTSRGNGCLACLVHRDAEEDDEDISFLTRSLQHRSDLHMNITGLSSGYSKEVHGQIQIRWNNIELSEAALPSAKTAQFKITDKNVAFFAKGMSSAVL